MSIPEATALVARDVSVALGGRNVLDKLSLDVPTGRITALLGPNGAGKTTFLRCCTGLLQPDEGTIDVLGGAPGRADVVARVGVMPQSTGAWSGINARELLRYLASLYASPQPVTALMDALGIVEFARTPYRRLSGGQQQAVNLAGALVGRPELVFLDEPTAGMDPHARRATWRLLEQLRGAGAGVLMTTHAMDEAAALADHVVILDRGRVTGSGTVAELTRDGRTLEQVFLDSTTATVGGPR